MHTLRLRLGLVIVLTFVVLVPSVATSHWSTSTSGIGGIRYSGGGDSPAVLTQGIAKGPPSQSDKEQPNDYGVGKVRETLDLQNGTALPGNYVPAVCDSYSSTLVVPQIDRVYVTCESPGAVIEFNATSGVAIRTLDVGQGPSALASNSSGDGLYVANNASGNITVVNTSAGIIVGSIIVGGNPDGLAFDSSNSILYVTSYSTGTVTAISSLNDSVVKVISVGAGSEPDGLGLDTVTGNLYVSEIGSKAVGILSTANGSLIGSIPLRALPLAVDCDPTSGNVYVATYNATSLLNVVVEFSGITQAPIADLTTGFYPNAIAVSPTDDHVFVSNGIWGNVSVFNGSSHATVGSVTAGQFPDALSYDDVTHTLFVANLESSDVTEISDNPLIVLRVIALDTGPRHIAWDDVTRNLYVSNEFSASLVEVNGSSGLIQSSERLGYGLDGVAVDTANGHLYVSNPGGIVYDVSGTDALSESIHTGTPWGLAYDSSNGYVYTDNFAANNVTIINSSTDLIVGWISLVGGELLGGNPEDIAFDAANGNLYVAVHGGLGLNPGNISIINGTSNRYVTSITQYWPGTIPGPSSLMVDSLNHELYVTDDYSDVLWAFNISTDQMISVTQVGDGPEGVALDPQNGFLYVTNSGSDNVTVVNSTTNQVVGNISVGAEPWGVAFDPLNGDVYVANEGSGTLSVINETHYAVTFTETGLPSNQRWGVTFNEATLWSVAQVLGFDVINGSYTFEVEAIPGWHLSSFPYQGPITVNGSPLSESLVWGLMDYNLTFVESGLPSGSNWSVDCDGIPGYSTESTISFSEPNGSYDYTVGGVPGWHLTSSSEPAPIIVNGSSVSVSLAWVITEYNLVFTETGLPPGSSWKVLLNDSAQQSSNSTISFTAPNGSYAYTVYGPAGWHISGYPRTGTIVVDGSSITQPTSWIVTTFAVEFTAAGLPTATSWSVTVQGTTYSTNTSSIDVPQPNGSYSFRVDPPAGYRADPSSGLVNVTGSATCITIQFSSQSAHSTGVSYWVWLATGSGAFLVGVIAFVIWRGKRSRSSRDGVSK